MIKTRIGTAIANGRTPAAKIIFPPVAVYTGEVTHTDVTMVTQTHTHAHTQTHTDSHTHTQTHKTGTHTHMYMCMYHSSKPKQKSQHIWGGKQGGMKKTHNDFGCW
eukprot:GHVQ01020129.1.p2 GENE.GHVQ01020129.1~~GHVQ01020129.1.p2  ORF type:complete len:106 (+),score=21.92 GHVQ01020129.1:201-518(+)